jgi:hypothetical protein
MQLPLPFPTENAVLADQVGSVSVAVANLLRPKVANHLASNVLSRRNASSALNVVAGRVIRKASEPQQQSRWK